jgi:phage/plasmid-like protein (TIGR03299 family)
VAATFSKGATIEEIRAAANLEWDAISVIPSFTLPGQTGLYSAPDHRLIVRSDTGQVLGQASAGYKVHSMSEVLGYFQSLCETHGGGWRIITVGALREGSVIWAQAERDESAEVIPGQVIAHRLMMQTSFDGTLPTGCSDGETVIVCNNTRSINWTEAGKKATQRHRSRFDGERLTAKAGINTGSEAWVKNIQALRILADTACNPDQGRDILRALLEKPTTSKAKPAPAATPSTAPASDFAALLAGRSVKVLELDREHRNVSPIMALWQGQGRGAEAGDQYTGTRYGLLQAVTEFTDHHAGRSWDTGRTSAYFGQGAALKDRAFEMIAAGTAAAELIG